MCDGVAKDLLSRAVQRVRENGAECRYPVWIDDVRQSVERVSEDICHVIGWVAEQTLRIDGQPAASAATHDIIVMQIAMKGFMSFWFAKS